MLDIVEKSLYREARLTGLHGIIREDIKVFADLASWGKGILRVMTSDCCEMPTPLRILGKKQLVADEDSG